MGFREYVQTKKANEETKMVIYSIFLVLWPGKFPQTSCFLMSDKKWCGWVLAGINGFVWVCWGAETLRRRRVHRGEGIKERVQT